MRRRRYAGLLSELGSSQFLYGWCTVLTYGDVDASTRIRLSDLAAANTDQSEENR